MIDITVNGQVHPMPAGSTVLDVLKHLDLEGKRLAVEMNGEIVPKSQHALTPLADQTCLEIVIAVGGG